MKFLKILLLLLLLCPPALAQQTNTLPQRLEVKPREADRADNSLCVWGGISAGTACGTVIVDSTGVLSVAAAIADGSITFAKMADESCNDNEVMGWDDDTTAWVCMAVSALGGLTESGGPYTITGAWTFDPSGVTGTVFGDATTAQQLIHIYNSAGSGGMRIQGNVGAYDILAQTNFTIGDTDTGAVLTITDTTGKVTLVGDLDVGDDLAVTGTITTGDVGGSWTPLTTDAYDLGSSTKFWRGLYTSKFYATVFQTDTAQLLNGYFIVGKSAGNFADQVDAADATVDLGTNNLSVPQFILIRSIDAGTGLAASEYMTITADVDGAGAGTVYNVTRDATGAWPGVDPTWPKGTPWLLLGQDGDGRVEIYAAGGLPRLSMFQQTATANGTDEIVRIGNLDGMTQMGGATGRYGLIIGQDSTAYLKYQHDSNGTPAGDDGFLIVQGAIRATTGWFGTSASDGVKVDDYGLQLLGNNKGAIYAGGKTSATDTDAGFWLGTDGAGGWDFHIGNSTTYLRWDEAPTPTLTVQAATIQTAANCGSSGGACVKMSSAGLTTYNSSNAAQVNLATTSTGALTAGAGNVVLDASGIYISPIGSAGAYTGTNAVKWTTDNTNRTAIWRQDAVTPYQIWNFDNYYEASGGYAVYTTVYNEDKATSGGSRDYVYQTLYSAYTDSMYTVHASTLDSTVGATWRGAFMRLQGGDSAGQRWAELCVSATAPDKAHSPASSPACAVGYTITNSTNTIVGATTLSGAVTFTGTFAIENTAPYIQMTDTTASATDYHITVDGNDMSIWSGTYGAGTEQVRISTDYGLEALVASRVKVAGTDQGFWATDAASGGNQLFSILRAYATNHMGLTSYDAIGFVTSTSTSSVAWDFYMDVGGRNNNEFTVKGQTTNSGSDIGSVLIVERGDNAATDIPGMILLYEADGGYGFLYIDNSGLLRVADVLGTDVPEADGTPSNTAGAVIGDQTSYLESKNVIQERLAPTDGLNVVLSARVFDFTYKDGRYNGEVFTGIITNYNPALGKDGGRSLNEVSLFGYLIESIQALQDQINVLEAELNALKTDVKDKKDPKPPTDVGRKTKPNRLAEPIPVDHKDALGVVVPIPPPPSSPLLPPPPKGGD